MRRGTYSIVARDPATGELGVAVQSHWFSVGSVVSWARAGVGAVATQSLVEPAYGPRALDLMEAGATAGEALRRLVAEDPHARVRQVGVVDAAGRVATHTGDGCIAFAGDAQGEDFTVQANMMSRPEVWPAMKRAFEEADGPLSRRLLAALLAAEAAGGDVRGRQSAALLIVPAEGEEWTRTSDVRVEDHADPLGELTRLVDLSEAYALGSEGDDLMGAGRHDEAADRFTRAAALAPDNDELLFWSGLAAAQTGDMATALERVRRAIAMHGGWRDLLDRLEPDIAPSADAVRRALAGAG
ncbi:MAG: hypothetical protein QOD73_2663 [Solirubrobacteraceae bacterium]|jgi:uncharacterized Ntn-hydrolase superfamily protein|nr:hypothetical protein [Solirubrobacteraceae bacterium]